MIILALFIAIFGPAGCPPPESARRNRTRGEIAAICLAIRNYEGTYGHLPFGDPKKETDIVLNDNEDSILQAILTGDNARGTIFLDPRPDGGKYLDPWKQRYRVILDTNYDGKIVLNGKEVKKHVLVYSTGKNGIDEHGDGDDVVSWRE